MPNVNGPSERIQRHRGTPSGPMFGMENPFFGLLPAEFVPRKKEYFTYNIRFNTLGASQTATQSASVQNDSDFVWCIGSAVVTSADFATITDNVPILVELVDSASGVQLQDSPTHFYNVFGSVTTNYQTDGRILPVPKIFRAGGQISARLQNQIATALVVNLAFIGFKVYRTAA